RHLRGLSSRARTVTGNSERRRASGSRIQPLRQVVAVALQEQVARLDPASLQGAQGDFEHVRRVGLGQAQIIQGMKQGAVLCRQPIDHRVDIGWPGKVGRPHRRVRRLYRIPSRSSSVETNFPPTLAQGTEVMAGEIDQLVPDQCGPEAKKIAESLEPAAAKGAREPCLDADQHVVGILESAQSVELPEPRLDQPAKTVLAEPNQLFSRASVSRVVA